MLVLGSADLVLLYAELGFCSEAVDAIISFKVLFTFSVYFFDCSCSVYPGCFGCSAGDGDLYLFWAMASEVLSVKVCALLL